MIATQWLEMIQRVSQGDTITVKCESYKRAVWLRHRFYRIRKTLKGEDRALADGVTVSILGSDLIFSPIEKSLEARILEGALNNGRK